jgi:hypothetical protein
MPNRRKSPDQSFDAKLGTLFCFLLLGQGLLPLLSLDQKFGLAVIELLIGMGFSLRHRHRYQWKWSGTKFSQISIGGSLGYLLFNVPFLFFWLISIRVRGFQGKASFSDWHEFLNPEKVGGILIQEWQALVAAFWENTPLVGFIMMILASVLLSLLDLLGLIDHTQEEFIKHCHNPPQPSRSTDDPGQKMGAFLRKFISARPLTIDKPPDAIRLEFPLSPPQELEDSLVIVLLVFVIFFAFGFSHVGYVLVTDLGPRTLTGFEMTGEWAIQIFSLIFGSLLVTFGPWVIWQWGFRNLFVRRVMEFKPDRLIISDRLWGRDRPKIEIPKMDLQPLRESKGQTTFPGNKLFWLQHRGKDVMLARFLLSTGMASIQTTYDRYRTTNFAEFYRDTESLNLPLD